MSTILETERLVLRGWRDEDAPSLFKYASDKRIGPAAGWLPHIDENYSRAVIRIVFSKEEVYAICLKGCEKEPIGSIGLTFGGTNERPLEEKEAELGFWIGRPFWGQGFMTEAAKEMVRHGFKDLNLERILCGYFHGNERSRRVQEKCGFKYLRTNEKTRVPAFNETRVEYINVITRDNYFFNEQKVLQKN